MRNITVRVHSDTPITSIVVNGTEAKVTKIEKDASALPFADRGASAISDVYAIPFAVDVQTEQRIVLSTAEKIAGDVDGDAQNTVVDALMALRALLQNIACSAADINGDGKFSLLDILQLLKAAAKEYTPKKDLAKAKSFTLLLTLPHERSIILIETFTRRLWYI